MVEEWTEADNTVFDVDEKIFIHPVTKVEFSFEDLIVLHKSLPY